MVPIEEAIKILQKKLEEIEPNSEKYFKTIGSQFEEIREVLRQRESELIVEVNDIKEKKKKELQLQKEELEMILQGQATPQHVESLRCFFLGGLEQISK